MTWPLRIERRLNTPGWLRLAVPMASLFWRRSSPASCWRPRVTTRSRLITRCTPLRLPREQHPFRPTFVYATPMLFTGLCAAFAFRMRTYNIGGEGQLYMGAVGLLRPGSCSATGHGPLLIIAMIVGGALAGMLLGGRFRLSCAPTCARTRVLTSLMSITSPGSSCTT